jgi:dihydroneopterin aldolase
MSSKVHSAIQLAGATIGAEFVTSSISAIFVEGLELQADIGVYPHEIGRTRRLIVDVTCFMPVPTKIADRLSETLDYDMIAAAAHLAARGPRVDLVETLAHRIIDGLFEDERVIAAKIRIEKPDAVAGARLAGVEIFRRRD